MTSAYMQWLFHSGERAVAHGSLVLINVVPLLWTCQVMYIIVKGVLESRYFSVLYTVEPQ